MELQTGGISRGRPKGSYRKHEGNCVREENEDDRRGRPLICCGDPKREQLKEDDSF